jgi:hypothetical protein
MNGVAELRHDSSMHLKPPWQKFVETDEATSRGAT